VTALFMACLIAPAFAQAPGAWQDPSPHQVRFVTVAEGVRLEVLDWGGSGRAVVLAGRLVSRLRHHAARLRRFEPTRIGL